MIPILLGNLVGRGIRLRLRGGHGKLPLQLADNDIGVSSAAAKQPSYGAVVCFQDAVVEVS